MCYGGRDIAKNKVSKVLVDTLYLFGKSHHFKGRVGSQNRIKISNPKPSNFNSIISWDVFKQLFCPLKSLTCQILFPDMKTNKLFVCQYCDKTLSCKRSVELHINRKHGADTPVMYQEILADPRDVDTLLGKKKAKNVKCINPVKEVKALESKCPEPVLKVTEVTTGPEVTEFSSSQEIPELTVNQEVTGVGIGQEVAGLGTGQDGAEFVSGQDVAESKSGQKVTGPRSSQVVTSDNIKTKNYKKKSDKKEKCSSYDFRKLSNQFSLPAPAQVQIRSSDKNHYVQDGENSSMDITVGQFGDQSLGGDYSQGDSPPKQQDHPPDSPGKSISRLRFKVPYRKKTIRGKCQDWTNCENCSRVDDCKECKYCLNPHLK